eukprot:351855-Chlamydomonas_euryale.AAC.7
MWCKVVPRHAAVRALYVCARVHLICPRSFVQGHQDPFHCMGGLHVYPSEFCGIIPCVRDSMDNPLSGQLRGSCTAVQCQSRAPAAALPSSGAGLYAARRGTRASRRARRRMMVVTDRRGWTSPSARANLSRSRLVTRQTHDRPGQVPRFRRTNIYRNFAISALNSAPTPFRRDSAARCAGRGLGWIGRPGPFASRAPLSQHLLFRWVPAPRRAGPPPCSGCQLCRGAEAETA